VTHQSLTSLIYHDFIIHLWYLVQRKNQRSCLL